MSWIQKLSELHVPTEDQANVLGVILYTDAHANIKKVLNDKDYWDAFDEESGPRWNVFAVRAFPGKYELPSFPPDTIGFMIPVWKEPRDNKQLLNDFQIRSTEDLPLLVVFSESETGVLRRTFVQLKDESVESAYQSLKVALRVVAQSLEKVRPEYLGTDGAYDAVHRAVKNHTEWQTMKKGIRALERIKSLFL